ncbi:competence protein ComGG [Streptococcus suis]|nr:competence protein ComGG [Streptococcus suis]
MLLKKKVKAGILLYALLMLAVFSLLLQFYLHRQEAESRLVQVARQETTAYIMAQMVLDRVEEGLQEHQAVAEKVASQTAQKKGDETVANQIEDEEEVKEAQPTRESQETNEKPAQTSSKKKEEIKPIETEGSVLFREGVSHYRLSEERLYVTVELLTGEQYFYQIPLVLSSEGR